MLASTVVTYMTAEPWLCVGNELGYAEVTFILVRYSILAQIWAL